MIEEWRNIEGYEGMYQVSNFGEVRSLNFNRTGRMEKLIPSLYESGYLFVTLCKNNKRNFYIHRLVAKAFLPNPMNLPQINHKDEDKTNNRVDNLEWCNGSYNNNYGTRNQRVAEKLSKPVLQFTKLGVFIREWSSINEAGRCGFHKGNIWSCCNGERKTHKGYIWRFK